MKISIIIPVFERPDELALCLESIRRTEDLREVSIVMIDDFSKNSQTKRIFENFFISGVPICKIRNEVNYKVSINIKKGVGKAMLMGAELLVVLDADAIVKPNWLERIKDLKRSFPDSIISGFNTLTKSRQGSPRHPIIREENDFVAKHSIGGINMAFDYEQYKKFVNVGLDNAIRINGHWDTITCQIIKRNGGEIIVTKPSVVEHIARTSTLSHTDNPDRSADWIWDASGIFSKQEVFPVNRTNGVRRREVFRR